MTPSKNKNDGPMWCDPLPRNEANFQIAIEMTAAGAAPTTILHELGISEATLYRWRRNPKFQAAVSERVQAYIRAAAGQAYKNIVELSQSAKSENVRLNASKDLLERGGHISKQVIDLNTQADIVIDFED